MFATSSAFKLTGVSSILALCFLAAPAGAQSAGGTGGASGAGGATSSSGGVAAAAGNANIGGLSGGESAGASAGGASSSAGAPSGSAGAPSGNLVTNGTFDTVADPWWGNASGTTDYPADEALAVTGGQLCATMTAGGQHPWDVLIGLSGVALLPNQYYHISFAVTVDAARTIKFKTGLGDTPYTDYFLESIPVTAIAPAAAQTFDYTYLNLRNDPTAQFQFQIGGTPGTVCIDNVVIEPVSAPTPPTYVTQAPSHHPFKYYDKIVKMGTAVDTPIFLSNSLHNSIVAGEFGMITPANSMKMNLIQPAQGVFDFTDTDALVSWAQTNGLEFRGHPLIWHTQVPTWLSSGTFDHDALVAIMYAHIDGLMSHYVGKFPYWDVVNEAMADDGTGFRKTLWHDGIGDDFIDLAFAHAHAADPSAKLAYNDYNIEQKGNVKADHVFDFVKGMKARGVPIDVVGFQAHYFVEPSGATSKGVPNMQNIRDNMARYEEIGVKVQITECDFRVGKPLDDTKAQVQNKFYADLLQVCIDAPNCDHFTVWGLSDLDSWVPSTFPDYDYAHLFDTKLMPKPDYFAMSQVFAQYNADGSLIAPAAGGAGGTGGAAGASAVTPEAPSSSGKSSGCALASSPSQGGQSAWLAPMLGMIGVLLLRRRKQLGAARR